MQIHSPGFDTLIPALRFKKFDAVIAGIEVIPMREKQVAFSHPYRQALSGVVVTAKDAAHTFADLKDKKIGVVKGTLHQHYLREKQKAVHAVPYDSDESALSALKEGVISGVMGDQETLTKWLEDNPDYAMMDERATDPGYYGKQYAIAVRKDDPELLNNINAALDVVKPRRSSRPWNRSGLNSRGYDRGVLAPARALKLNKVFAIVGQFRDRFANIVHRLMGSLFLKAVENFRLPATSQLFERADVQIAVVEIRFQLRHIFKQEAAIPPMLLPQIGDLPAGTHF